jgi:hypothetical protein
MSAPRHTLKERKSTLKRVIKWRDALRVKAKRAGISLKKPRRG